MGSAAQDPTYVSGAIIAIQETAPGQYAVTQPSGQLSTPKTQGVEAVIPINYSFGPLTISGTIDTSNMTIHVRVSILGITIGSFSGNLKDGISININIVAASGFVKLYLKNGNELWVQIDIKIVFDGHYTGDYKIITI